MIGKLVAAYVCLRRTAGYQIRVVESLLDSFANFAQTRGEKRVRTATAIAWSNLAPSPQQRARRYAVVIRFARHVSLENPAHEVPPAGVFGRSFRRRTPFIFGRDDIRRLLAASASLGPSDSLRPRTFTTLFGLLAATGLRVSEALRLHLQDVTEDGLRIVGTKFKKSRLVPLHPTTRAALERYLEARSRVVGMDTSVFLSLRRRRLTYATANATFLQLARSVGIHPGPGMRGPRIHDLRHTFAVRSLEACGATRLDVSRHMVALSTYLGHRHIADTYWYLQATPALMEGVADLCETRAKGGRR